MNRLSPCVVDNVPENRGNRFTGSGDIAPHSVAQYQPQQYDMVPNSTGRAILGLIEGISLNRDDPALRLRDELELWCHNARDAS